MANSRWRKLNQFIAVSGTGKKQSAFGTFLADAAIDTRENCELEMDLEIERTQERDCANRDLVAEPVRRRLRRFRLTYENPTAQQAARAIAYIYEARSFLHLSLRHFNFRLLQFSPP